MKKSLYILLAIGTLLFVAGLSIGVAYILTGKSLSIGGTNYFAGHFFNENGSINTEEMPEKLAMISFLVSIFGYIAALLGITIQTKGKTRAEKKEYFNSKFLIFIIGLSVGILSLLVLMILTPKVNSNDSFKSMIWFYIILVAIFVSFVTTITGIINSYKKLKKPIISQTIEDVIKKDEF